MKQSLLTQIYRPLDVDNAIYVSVPSLSIENYQPFDTLKKAENLISELPPQTAESLILIGGQALLLWAEHYLIDQLTGEERASIASDDLDFIGRIPVIKACAEAWDAKYKISTIDDSTPNTGIIFLNDDGAKVEDKDTVDFLDSAYGLKPIEVDKHCDEVILGEKRIKILSTPLCLKSRIYNVCDLKYGPKKKEREVTRINIAIKVCRAYICDLVDHHKTTELKNVINYLLQKVINTKCGKKIVKKYGVDFYYCFPQKIFCLLEETWEKEIPKRMSKIQDLLENFERENTSV